MTDHRPNVEDYAAARRRDDALIPNLKCEHGSRLRICGYPACIAERARRLRKATRDGKRDYVDFIPDEPEDTHG